MNLALRESLPVVVVDSEASSTRPPNPGRGATQGCGIEAVRHSEIARQVTARHCPIL